ncbi:MAG: hypothetical protein A3F72_06060 [Bacteroidetes bacterium RIFCSPLOWO2_12_FULL_35_15]|nr:MAG: hypothetical protein A3F72_06060 [Bacteroidetes bacterium RIFCSPLOWO2_12_FULL_35_15]
MKPSLRIVICFLLLTTNGFAQNRIGRSAIDSLRILLQNEKEDTVKVNYLNELASGYENIDSYDTALIYAYQALRLAQQLKFKKGTSKAYTLLGNTNMAKCNYDKALENHLAAWKINEEMGDKIGISASYNNIGNVYYAQRNLDRALENHLASLKIDVELNNKEDIAGSYINIGNIYLEQGNYGKALENYFPALKIGKETGNKRFLAMPLINIGNVYEAQGEYDKALENYLAAQKITEIGKNKLYSAAISNNIGIIYKKKKNYKEAIVYLKKGVDLSTAIGVKDLTMEGYKELAEVYEKMKDFENAYQYQQFYSQIKDSIFNNESNKKMIEMQNKYETQKKDKEIIIFKKDKQISDSAIQKQRIFILFVISTLLLVLVFAVFVFRSLRKTQKQKFIIQYQKKRVEEQQQQITDSITYALTIQESILPKQELFKRLFKDSFILFLPKDIVSGDFYWIKEVENELLFSVIDCTGHGVPGAFMSLHACNNLERIVTEHGITSPSIILDELNRAIVNTMSVEGAVGLAKSGMDMTLVKMNKEKNEIEYSGARNSGLIVRENKIIEMQADAMPIGNFSGTKFSLKKEKLITGDMIYLFSDGYKDQKGGPLNKRFFAAPFKEMLQEISQSDCLKQQTIILKKLNDWKGNQEQIDDICVIGVRI